MVYSGHDHLYERIVSQFGIAYFVSGAAGRLRKGDLQWSAMTAADDDRSFVPNEIVGDDLYFQVISRRGGTVDSGGSTDGSNATMGRTARPSVATAGRPESRRGTCAANRS